MKITTIMSRDPVVISSSDTMLRVSTLFEHAHFHHLIVVERGRICGVLSDRDLFKASSPFLGTKSERDVDTATLKCTVNKIMSHPPVVLTEDATVMDAVAMFEEHSISCIPIVDGERRPVGIVSWRDIFRALLLRKTERAD